MRTKRKSEEREKDLPSQVSWLSFTLVRIAIFFAVLPHDSV